MERSKEIELEEKAQKYIAGGCLGKFKPPVTPFPVFVNGHGSKLTDSKGKTYVDFIMGSGPLILGHSHPAIMSAVQEQLHRGTHYYWLNDKIVNLAEKIVDAAPCAEAVKFSTTGTEATFHALRIARVYTGREKILKFEGGYHGVHDYSLMSSSPKVVGSYPIPSPDSGGIPRAIRDSILVAPFNDYGVTSKIINEFSGSIAAVLIEPLQRIIKPKGSFLSDVIDLARKHRIICIFDEVVTGFRLDYGGAQEHYGAVPDLAVYGKALAGGFPISAICGKREILECTDPARSNTAEYAYFSGTLNGNPIGGAAGCACLDEVRQEGVLKKLHDRGERLMLDIRSIAQSRGIPAQVVGDGPVLQIFFTDKEVSEYPDTLNHNKTIGAKVGRSMIEKGIWMNPNSKIYLSLAHTESDFESLLNAFDSALKAL